MRVRLLVLAVLVAALVPPLALGGVAGGKKLEAKLSGKAETPKGPSAGAGEAEVTLDAAAGKVCWTIKVSGIDTPTAAHIHKGGAGVSGPVVVPFGAAFKAKGCTAAPAATRSGGPAPPGPAPFCPPFSRPVPPTPRSSPS